MRLPKARAPHLPGPLAAPVCRPRVSGPRPPVHSGSLCLHQCNAAQEQRTIPCPAAADPCASLVHVCSEEIKCRFCQAPLPDWRNTLTPRELPPASKAPVMAINVDGKEHKVGALGLFRCVFMQHTNCLQ